MARWRSLRFEFTAMASTCSIAIDGTDEARMRRAAAGAIAEVRRIEQKYSRFRDDSIISRINRAAGGMPVDIDAETSSLLDFAGQLWTLSDGLFDITSGVLQQAWDFRQGRLPDAASLQRLVALVGWQHVERDGRQVRLAVPGMALDVGGFGKEYAADRAAAQLQASGIGQALVNLGGDLHALGPEASERGMPAHRPRPWQVDIQHPRLPAGTSSAPLASLSLARGGLATSGDYERFFVRDGRRYCHLLDPRTGWPVSHWQSISVLTASTTAAGALATIAMLKQEDALAWLARQGASYLAVGPDGCLSRDPAAAGA